MQALSQLSYSPTFVDRFTFELVVVKTGRMLRANRNPVNTHTHFFQKIYPTEQSLKHRMRGDGAYPATAAAHSMAASIFSHSLVSFFDTPPSSSTAWRKRKRDRSGPRISMASSTDTELA